jgi:hypothetical protein
MKMFKWTVEFQVSENWVADGFNLDDDRALEMLSKDLGWAIVETELKAKVVKHPNLDEVAQCQGYANAKVAGLV